MTSTLIVCIVALLIGNGMLSASSFTPHDVLTDTILDLSHIQSLNVHREPPISVRTLPEVMSHLRTAETIAAKLAPTEPVQAELILVQATWDVLPVVQQLNLPLYNVPCVEGSVYYASSDCSQIIGGPGPNVYRNNASILIDTGGDDVYRNNAGGASIRTNGFGAAILFDLSGNDTYISTGWPKDAVQGAGYLGAGLLIDLEGNDTYTTIAVDDTTNGRFAAQGSGLDGAGVLYDANGSDNYTSRNAAQGVGLIGFGLLLDNGGPDHYLIPWTFDSEAGQGVGCFGTSIGALIHLGVSDDVYESAVDDMQGMGCIGGLGYLYDQGGNDSYIIHKGNGLLGGLFTEQSGWGQGYGELGGMGILQDDSGNDLYLTEPGGLDDGVNVQGSGLLGGTGVLIDQSGDDTYIASRYAQGAGDFGTGILLDIGGNDHYYADQRCQGYGNAGPGILLDIGGKDSYTCGSSSESGVSLAGSGGLRGDL